VPAPGADGPRLAGPESGDLPEEVRRCEQAAPAIDAGWQKPLADWARQQLDLETPDLLETAKASLEQVLFDEALKVTGGDRQQAATAAGLRTQYADAEAWTEEALKRSGFGVLGCRQRASKGLAAAPPDAAAHNPQPGTHNRRRPNCAAARMAALPWPRRSG
jgi:hypothetical protein